MIKSEFSVEKVITFTNVEKKEVIQLRFLLFDIS